jgi:hypothetical protein
MTARDDGIRINRKHIGRKMLSFDSIDMDPAKPFQYAPGCCMVSFQTIRVESRCSWLCSRGKTWYPSGLK